MKKISNTLIIKPGTIERFLPFSSSGDTESYSGGKICGGISDPLKPGYQVVYRKTPSDEWIYIIRGTVIFFWEEKEIPAEEGDFVFLPSGLVPHAMTVRDADAGMIWFHVRFDPDSQEKERIPLKPFRQTALYGKEIRLLAELLYLQKQKGMPEQNHTMHQIREYLYREVSGVCQTTLLHQESLVKVFDQVRKDLRRDWTVQELAQGTFLSVSHFFAVTKLCFGESPLEYVRRLRMEHGVHLLLRTDLSLEQIAEECGYSNAFAFSKAFRKYSGESPGKFRKSGTLS